MVVSSRSNWICSQSSGYPRIVPLTQIPQVGPQYFNCFIYILYQQSLFIGILMNMDIDDYNIVIGEMLSITEDPKFIETLMKGGNNRKKNKQETTPSQQLEHIIKNGETKEESFNQLKDIAARMNSISSQHLANLFEKLFTIYISPSSIIQQSNLKPTIQKVIQIAISFLKLPHDHTEVIKVLRSLRQSTNNTLQKFSIDPQFILLLCWSYGNRHSNILIIQTVIDAFGLELIISRKTTKKHDIVSYWQKFIEESMDMKNTLQKIQCLVHNMKHLTETFNVRPTHIYIPL